jgi:hypothetical protein
MGPLHGGWPDMIRKWYPLVVCLLGIAGTVYLMTRVPLV